MAVAHFRTVEGSLARAGHSVDYSEHLHSLVLFGGWPPPAELGNETAAGHGELDTCPLYVCSLDDLGLGCSAPSRSVTWNRVESSSMPKTRHGHHVVCVGSETFVLGGSHWAHGDSVATHDLVFDHQLLRWSTVETLCPPRFCSAIARSPNSHHAVVSDRVVYLFGGLDVNKNLTNQLFRLWLPSCPWEELPAAGSVPLPQFKSTLVADVPWEPTVEQRRGSGGSNFAVNDAALLSGRLFHMDGFLQDASLVKFLHLYEFGTGMWRSLCCSPDLVRSQIVHVAYTEDAAIHNGQRTDIQGTRTSRRVAHFTLFGGMPSRKGRRYRSNALATFLAHECKWERSKVLLAPVPGLTSHVVVLLPSQLNAGRCGRSNPVSVSVGGNEDPPGNVFENDLGLQTQSLHLFQLRSLTLKELVAKHIHAMQVSYRHCSDEILDELF